MSQISSHCEAPESNRRESAILIKLDSPRPVFKIENDPKVTRVGSFLRRLSLDEIPRFINVHRGYMSRVGHRFRVPVGLSLILTAPRGQ